MLVISILIQLLRGLAYLHARPNPVIHRDIKPANILVEDREREVDTQVPGPWIKLADFGLAREGTKCGGLAGTFSYVAPEAYGSESCDKKLDIWSVGVVGMQLLQKGNLPNPSTTDVHGPVWCDDIIEEAENNCDFCKAQDEQRWGKYGSSVRTFWSNHFVFDRTLKVTCHLARV